MDRNDFKALRQRLGLTQQKFGEQLGFSKQWARMRVSEIERGVKGVSKRTELICRLIRKRRKK